MNNPPVTTQWIDVPSSDGSFGAYLALPPAGRGPGLLLLQEIFGVNEHIRGVAEQYALAGFVVTAPDLFWRKGARIELGYEGDDRQRADRLMSTIQTEAVVRDMQATLATLRTRPECSGKVGAIGYCMGGRLAYTAAALCDVDAAVAYYGGRIQDQLHLAAQINCPIQFHYGERDDHIPLSAVEAVREAVVDKDAEIHVYAGAQHGFNCWSRASYSPASAALAHGRSLAFLAQQLF
ncbi:MAG TPA: dienelactone hydrolase family protein [Ideonella sp.]|uniref:dienelactone hydrolase family protein n=1 Tax=Ideonella sp. TaxID=1929293 RepID=UPI002E312342|nr:dienelactone hydrolase family protein [Ideonella sp.]HEX5682402.1 dienelactone hydrolase family protein [Ideonella sp.]